MKRSELMTLCAFALLCSVPQSTFSSNWEILLQSRRANCATSAGVELEHVDDEVDEQSDDFGLFETQIASVSSVQGSPKRGMTAVASTNASQHSILSTNLITVKGQLGASAEATGPSANSEADAFSDFRAVLSLDSSETVHLTGTASSFSFGQVAIRLDGPDFFSYLLHVQDNSAFFRIDETFDLEPGVYTFDVSTFADFEAFDGDLGGQGADWDLQLQLIECTEPSEPVLQTAYYAVDRGSNTVHRNFDLTGGGSWDSPGQFDIGATGHGLTVHPISNTIYFIDEGGGTEFLGTLDPNTGAVTSLTAISNSDPLALPGLEDIAFDANGTLYCIYEWIIPGVGFFGTVDVDSGLVTPTGWGQISFSGANARMAFDPSSGLLYFSTGSSLSTVDVVTGDITPVPLAAPPVFSALSFHPSGSPFIACTSSAELVEIHPGSGIVAPLSGALLPPTVLSGLDQVTTIIGGGDPVCTPLDGNLGDVTDDGLVTSADIAGFVDCITGPGGGIPSTSACVHADMQQDGDVDLVDFASFAGQLGALAP